MAMSNDTMSHLSLWPPNSGGFPIHQPFKSPSIDPFGGRSLLPDPVTSTNLRQRFKALAGTEKLKDDLIKEALEQLEFTERQLSSSQVDRDREIRFNRDVQLRESHLQSQLQDLKKSMDREAFVLVLLDGDHIIFSDELLQKGEDGGKEAADRLHFAVHDHIRRSHTQRPQPKIMARIYANVKVLGDAIHKAGLTEQANNIDDFIRGFNSGKSCFDFVDCGSCKDRADSKIYEIFKIYLRNVHCHEIIFGCPGNDASKELLEEVQKDGRDSTKVTLLHSMTNEEEQTPFTDYFRSTYFQGVFRGSELSCQHPMIDVSERQGSVHANKSIVVPSSSSPLTLGRMPSSSDTASPCGVSIKPATWASMTAAPFIPSATPSPTASSVKPVEPAQAIERNRLGQRIDKLDFTILNDDVRRVKKLKLCNPFFLQGECKNRNCFHDHEYPLSQSDKKILEYVARLTPCYHKTDCVDPKCIYGHRCPQNEPDRKDCYYKEQCRFDGWGHGIDIRMVKTTKV